MSSMRRREFLVLAVGGVSAIGLAACQAGAPAAPTAAPAAAKPTAAPAARANHSAGGRGQADHRPGCRANDGASGRGQADRPRRPPPRPPDQAARWCMA